ncbi:MAG: hypothetical protein AB7C90_00600 [Bacteroidales bacterium]
MKRLLWLATVLFLAFCLNGVSVAQMRHNAIPLTGYGVSWIGNDGGTRETHIPFPIEYLDVSENGTLVASSSWDEGLSNVILIRNGKLLPVPEHTGTGVGGRIARTAVVTDKNYLYQLMTQHGCEGADRGQNRNRKPNYPPCGNDQTWQVVRRYSLADAKGAPFTGGYGFNGDMLLVSLGSLPPSGITLHGDELFVADRNSRKIKVYPLASMQSTPIREFPMPEGTRELRADARGGLWVMTGQRLIRVSQLDGEAMGQTISFAEDVDAASFFVDTLRNQIWVANRGIDQNYLQFGSIYKKPVLSGTFGQKGGFLSGTKLKGRARARHFYYPSAVATGLDGTLYLATAAPGAGGSVIEAYSRSGSLLWKKESLAPHSGADFDPLQSRQLYTLDKCFVLEEVLSGKRADQLRAVTLDRFRFPSDSRFHPSSDATGAVFVRAIEGEKFLFVVSPQGNALFGYRFDASFGEVALPFLHMTCGQEDELWLDQNGDGEVQPSEKRRRKSENRYAMAFYVDQDGAIWKGLREQGVRMWPAGRLNAQGIPHYGDETSLFWNLPQGVTQAKRIWYDSRADQLFLSGYSNEGGHDRSDATWWCMGSTLARYDGWMARHKKSPGTDTRKVAPSMRLFLPFVLGQREEATPNAKSFAVEGDYIFVALAAFGKVDLYRRDNGQYLGQMVPGRYTDANRGTAFLNNGISARRNADGSYYILNPDRAYGKVLLYHWKQTR